jgi:hypothetical protein
MQKAYILHGGPIDVAHVGVAKSLSHKKKITGHVPEPNQRERERVLETQDAIQAAAAACARAHATTTAPPQL